MRWDKPLNIGNAWIRCRRLHVVPPCFRIGELAMRVQGEVKPEKH
jgi:hypothetical protein